jgi:hypothetical protein
VVSGVNSFGTLAAVDPLDTLQWQSSDLGKGVGVPAIHGDYVYIVDPNGVLLAFDRHTGAPNPNWHVQTNGSPLWPSFAIAHDGVLYTSQGGKVIALVGGAMSWSVDVGGALQSPLIDGSNALIGFVTATKQVVAIDLASHTQRWSVDAGRLGFTSDANDIILNGDGTLVLFGPSGSGRSDIDVYYISGSTTSALRPSPNHSEMRWRLCPLRPGRGVILPSRG